MALVQCLKWRVYIAPIGVANSDVLMSCLPLVHLTPKDTPVSVNLPASHEKSDLKMGNSAFKMLCVWGFVKFLHSPSWFQRTLVKPFASRCLLLSCFGTLGDDVVKTLIIEDRHI